MSEFKSSLTRSGNFINPDKVIVTEDVVTWEKRNQYLIGKDSKSISIVNISMVEINNKGWGTDVTIRSYGEGTIIVHNMTISDAKELKKVIEEYIAKAKSPKKDDYFNNNLK
jgi:hypothetical protein